MRSAGRRVAAPLAGLLAAALLAAPTGAEPAPRMPVEAFFRNPLLQEATLSPGGGYVAAVATIEDNEIIMVWDLETGERKPIIHFPRRMPLKGMPDIYQLHWVRWASDERLLFSMRYIHPAARGFHGLATHLYGIDRDGSNVENLGRRWPDWEWIGQHDDVLNWLEQDPKHVLLQILHRVYRVNVSSGKRRQRQKDVLHVARWGADHDGKIRLGFGRRNRTLIYQARVSGKGDLAKIYEGEYGTGPSFHVVGFGFDPKILYVASNHLGDRLALYAYDLEKKAFSRKLFEHALVDVSGPLHFSRLRRALLAVEYAVEESELHFFDEQYRETMRKIDRALPDRTNRITSTNLAEDRAIVVSSSDTQPPVAYLFHPEKLRMAKLFESHPDLDPELLVPMKSIRYQARDGRTLRGYLTLPKGVPARKLPVVVVVHGGPESRDVRGFDREVQFLANRGYAVFQVNFRGSSGYGSEHRRAGYEQWGFAMQDDLTDGVRWLIAQGTADPDRIAIYGGSYGGYAALMGLVRTPELYRCGISFAGVTDLVDHVRGDRWLGFDDLNEVRIGTDLERLEASSPARRADQIRAPVLLVHGDHDWRVHPRQAELMAQALKRAGVPHEFVMLEDENHGLWIESNRLEFYRRVEAFLGRHLQPRAAPDASAADTGA